MSTKVTNKIKELEDMAMWLRDKVMDEDNWELNAVALGEVICRKLVKCGLLELKDGNYHIPNAFDTTLSVVPSRATGKWIRNDNGAYSCSLCQSWIPEEQYNYARFCLHCGAKMEAEEND